MTGPTQALRTDTPSTELTRFNALRHGVLSRYTVFPWENADVRPFAAIWGTSAMRRRAQVGEISLPCVPHMPVEPADSTYRRRVHGSSAAAAPFVPPLGKRHPGHISAFPKAPADFWFSRGPRASCESCESFLGVGQFGQRLQRPRRLKGSATATAQVAQPAQVRPRAATGTASACATCASSPELS
jgi:hypothetical protein